MARRTVGSLHPAICITLVIEIDSLVSVTSSSLKHVHKSSANESPAQEHTTYVSTAANKLGAVSQREPDPVRS